MNKQTKNENKHTLGPWSENTHSYYDCVMIQNSEGCLVTLVKFANNANYKEDAHLIAAAPMMLEALQRLLLNNRLMNTMTREESQSVLHAIQKATGGAE